MTRIIVRQVVLDRYNLEHISKHNISEAEVIEAGKNIVYHKRSYNKCYLTISRSGTRIITLVLKRKGLGKYYLITARDSDKKERRRLYEKEKQNSKV